jgi:hypothetical protein
MGRKEMQAVRHHGAPRLRVKAKHLTEIGVEVVDGRVTAVSADARPVLDDGRVLDVANVIWCTGFRQTFDWIDLPIVGDDGWPREYRGGVDSAPGLFFCGLSFQYAFSSMVLPGLGRDAAYVVKKIAARAQTKSLLRPQAAHIAIRRASCQFKRQHRGRPGPLRRRSRLPSLPDRFCFWGRCSGIRRFRDGYPTTTPWRRRRPRTSPGGDCPTWPRHSPLPRSPSPSS